MTTETEIVPCPEAPRCTLPNGHTGSHGIDMGGFILAPFEGTRDKTDAGEIVDLPCNTSTCEGPMRMQKFVDGGGAFTCTKCEQQVRILADGGYTEIFRTLFPSQMNAMMKRDFAEHECTQRQFVAKASLLCGSLDDASYAEELTKIEAAVDEYLVREGLAPKPEATETTPRPWWRRFLP